MIRIIISLVLGFVVFGFLIVATGNILISFVIGIVTGIGLSMITEKGYFEGIRKRREERQKLEQEGYHYGKGFQEGIYETKYRYGEV